MPNAITIPRLGWNMEEGVFAGWLKRDGEAVRAGEPLFSLEGDKATQDVESIDPGILKIPPTAPVVGDRLLVGAVIGYLLQPGEADPAEAAAPASGASPEGDASGRSPADGEGGTDLGRAVVQRIPSPAGPTEVGPARIAPIGAGVAVPGRDGPRSTPLARRIARERGIDWTTLRGSGHGGRIRKADIPEAAGSPPAPPASRSLPIGPARRTIAARLVESQQTTAPVTLTTTVDATNLVNLRGQFKEAGPAGRAVPSFTDFLVKLTALALRDHPLLHARWAGDRIEVPEEAHIGLAVDTEAGLLVPVIRGPAALGLGPIAERSRDLIRRAREGKLPAGEMQGGTFTITNLGAFGIDAFTPIINPPEAAILGIGRIARQPVMAGDQVVGRERLTLSLTFDHRIVDGAPAARFLQDLGRIIENPGPWLIG